jgi:hypothetical protein
MRLKKRIQNSAAKTFTITFGPKKKTVSWSSTTEDYWASMNLGAGLAHMTGLNVKLTSRNNGTQTFSSFSLSLTHIH